MQSCKSPLALLAIGMALALPASAQMPLPDDGHDHCGGMVPPGQHGLPDDKFLDGPLPPFLHGLDLSEAQRDAIFSILHAQAPLLRDKAKSLRKAGEALRTLPLSSQYDDAQAGVLAAALADDIAALSLLRALSEHQIYALLTPEQRKQAAEAKSGRFDFHPMSHRAGRASDRLRAI